MGYLVINITTVREASKAAILDALSPYDRLVEVGIGRRPEVAAALVDAGKRVVATDVYDRSAPDGVRFVRDDVTRPDHDHYRDADAIYALNLPPELHRPARDVAREHDAAFVFTTLGGDPPAVPVRPRSIPGDTLYVAREAPRRGRAGR